MSLAPELPANVVEAIRRHQKIEAIKLLCESRDMGLREAKEAVEDYSRQYPSVEAPGKSVDKSGVLPYVIIIALVTGAYFIYRFYS